MFNLLRITVFFICLLLVNSINIFAQQQETQIVAPKFQELDTNNDSFISPEEMSDYQVKQFEDYFKQMDTNNDNKISEAEYTDNWKLIERF